MSKPIVSYSPYTKRFYSADVSNEDLTRGDDHLGHAIIADFHPNRKKEDGLIEFQAEAVRRAERAIYQGASFTNDITNITVTELLGDIALKQHRDFYAILGVKKVAVPKLQAAVPIADKYRASAKVPEGVEAGQKKSTFTKATFALWKNVVSLEATKEAQVKGVYSPLQFDIDVAAGELSRVANTQIATVIESFTTASKGSWAAVTSGVSDRNPLTDITTEAIVLENLDARPNMVAVHPTVASAYLSNTWVKGQFLAPSNQMLGGLYPVPLYPSLQFLVDPAFTNTKATIYDTNGVLLGQGPLVAMEYENAKSLSNGYVVAEFLQPLKVSNNFGRTMTSVA